MYVSVIISHVMSVADIIIWSLYYVSFISHSYNTIYNYWCIMKVATYQLRTNPNKILINWGRIFVLWLWICDQHIIEASGLINSNVISEEVNWLLLWFLLVHFTQTLSQCQFASHLTRVEHRKRILHVILTCLTADGETAYNSLNISFISF